jgi:hypothetical protein
MLAGTIEHIQGCYAGFFLLFLQSLFQRGITAGHGGILLYCGLPDRALSTGWRVEYRQKAV